MSIYGIEIYRACKYHNITIDHFLKHLCHIVLDGTYTCATASVASSAIAYLLFGDTDFFNLVSGFHSTFCKLVA